MEGRCGTRYYFPRDAPPFSVTYGGYSSGGRRQPRHVISSDGRFKDAHETYGPLVTIFHDRGVDPWTFYFGNETFLKNAPWSVRPPKAGGGGNKRISSEEGIEWGNAISHRSSFFLKDSDLERTIYELLYLFCENLLFLLY